MQYFKEIDMDKITNNIWLGNICSATNVKNLKRLGIQKVLSVMENPAPKYKKEDNIKHGILKVADSPDQNLIQYFGNCLKFINGEENILVHCMGGCSRSPTFVIAYIMWKYMLSYNDAFEYVNSKRPFIFPNKGFKIQLKLFETLLIDNNYDLNKIDFNHIFVPDKVYNYYLKNCNIFI